MNIDLNIDNYNLIDIINLFNIKYDFDINDLKIAKKVVYQIHPDKSGLDKKYFLFFSKAYKYLYFIYNFRNKKYETTNNNNINNIKYSDIISDDEKRENYELLKNNKEINKDFNSWFNNMFESHKISSDYEKDGYGDWMKDNDNFKNFENCNNISKINESINKIKKDNYAIKKFDYQDFNSSSNGSNILNDKLEDYSSSNIFSKFGYNDLRKAHEESIIPVSEELMREQFNSIGDYEIYRKQQEISIPHYSLDESKEILNQQKNILIKNDNERAFRLAKQDEEVQQMNNDFWSKIKLLNQ